MGSANDQIRHLRLQRNIAAVAAIVLIMGSVADVLPDFLTRHRKSLAADNELREIQAGIVSNQTQTRVVEANIVKTQKAIRSLLGQPR